MVFLKVLKFLTSTSLFLALNSSLVVAFGYLLYDIAFSPVMLLIGFLATFSVYGLNKATDKNEDNINRPETAQRSTTFYLIPSIAALIISIILSALESIFALIIVLTPLLVGVVYSVKFSLSIPRLKEIVGVKSLTVAFSWALTGALLPATIESVVIEKIILVFSYIFTQLFVNTVLFDALDVKGDSFS
ncbi:MAG: hypothetical protein GX638_00390, partial [Crenarchaeota archaeon]|nr:hypothetical protein [Thermoproteota archaeon]